MRDAELITLLAALSVCLVGMLAYMQHAAWCQIGIYSNYWLYRADYALNEQYRHLCLDLSREYRERIPRALVAFYAEQEEDGDVE